MLSKYNSIIVNRVIDAMHRFRFIVWENCNCQLFCLALSEYPIECIPCQTLTAVVHHWMTRMRLVDNWWTARNRWHPISTRHRLLLTWWHWVRRLWHWMITLRTIIWYRLTVSTIEALSKYWQKFRTFFKDKRPANHARDLRMAAGHILGCSYLAEENSVNNMHRAVEEPMDACYPFRVGFLFFGDQRLIVVARTSRYQLNQSWNDIRKMIILFKFIHNH